jgi:phosphoribosyl-ATP pyrophosphohydrolase
MAFTLSDLESVIASRASADAENSYTKSLLDKGPEHCAKKMGEEAFEVALAAMHHESKALIAESADLVYHWLVLLRARGIAVSSVMEELERRTAQSGLAEKASRPKS